MTVHYGKYRGVVTNNIDPHGLGRLQATVPSVMGGAALVWALPCVPFAGDGVGFFMLPPIGANVWVEFEAGNLDYPIWAGCFWSEGEAPFVEPLPAVHVIQTQSARLTLSDEVGDESVTIEVMGGAGIRVGGDRAETVDDRL